MSGLLPSLGRALPIASSSRAAAFSTSAIVLSKTSLPKKGSRSFARKKEGGRKAGNTRIKQHRLKLSSELAKPAPDMTDLVQLYPESIIAENVGKASVIPRKTFDVLQTFGLPAKVDKDLTLGAPATVVRKATLDIVKSLEDGKAGDSKEARYMITGERGAGKSMLLLQAVAYALESGWIVFYQPTATRWVDSSTQFAYNEKKMMFDQPEAAVDMLQKLLAVNRKRLSQIKLESAVELADATVKAGEGLDKLVEHGLKEDTKTAIATLDAVLDILSNQTQFPVLFAIDEVQALFRTSKYRRPDYKFLEAYHLGVPRMALEYLSGARELKRGAVLTATALSHTEYMPSDSLIAGLGLPPRRTMHAYTPIDETYLNYAKSGIKRFDVPFGMTGPEAAAMFQLFARKGWTSNTTDDVFMGGFTAASGNPNEMHRSWRESHQSFIAQAATPAFLTTPTKQ